MSQPYSNIGIPSELVFELPSSLPSCRKIEQRIQPYSQSKYTSAGQVAKFTIPQTDRTFINGQTMYLTGNLLFSNLGEKASAITNLDDSITTTGNMYTLLGSFYSMFSRQVTTANGVVLETIERPGELVSMLIAMTMSSSEKLAQSNSLGTYTQKISGDFVLDCTTNAGFMVNTTSTIPGSMPNSGLTHTFAIPIIGCLDAAKFIPMWNSNIELELTINDIKNWLTIVSGTFSSTASFELSDLELVFDSIELTPESYSMVMSNYPQKVILRTQSYLAGASSIPAINGSVDVPINARLSSLKQLYFYFNQPYAIAASVESGCADQTFGGINPNGDSVQFITNGQTYPSNRPLKLNNPSEIYMSLQKAFGSVKSYSHSGSIGKKELCRRATPNNLYEAPISNKKSLFYYGNKFYIAIDTEIINVNKQSLYNGIPTGVNSNIRLNIAETLPAALTCFYWCCYDILLEMDFQTGITRSIY